MLLLEVMAALAIFSFSALAAIGLLQQVSESERRTRSAEVRMADVDRLLTAYSLLERVDLESRLGRRAVGDYLVEIGQPQDDLFRISIGDSSGVDLSTLIYRPEPDVNR